MYQAVIVDDESWAIDYLVEKLNWNKYGFNIKNTFTDSLKALESIKANVIDVLLVDILMPNISGLELMEKIRHINSDIEIVITSAHDEFAYAKKAIQYNVFDYLLKPIAECDGDELLERLSRHISEKKRLSSKLNDVDMLEYLFSNKLDLKSLFAKYEYGYYKMLVVKGADSKLAESLFLEDLNRRILRIGKDKNLVIVNCPDYSGTLLRSNAPELIKKMGIMIGISGISGNRKETSVVFKQADMAVLDDFITSESGIIYFKEPDTSLVKDNVKLVLEIIKLGDTSKLDSMFYEVRNSFIKKNPGMGTVEMFYNYIILYLVNNFEKIDKKYQEVLEYDQIYFRYGSFEGMCYFLSEHIKDVLDKQPKVESGKNKQFIKIVEYVDSNYMKSVSLGELSRQFYLNSTYISTLFKKYMNKTFFEYVNDLRMSRASTLLNETDKMIFEVSDEVGYSDSFHFSKMFKKHYGVSPSEFRQRSKL